MNNILNKLITFALLNNIEIISTDELSTDSPSGANVDKKIIVLNMNWHENNQIPFQLAHEIGHILCEDKGSQVLYFTPTKTKMESGANKKAIDLLLPFYMEDKEIDEISSVEFMQQFGIPEELNDLVLKEMENKINS
ncbi:ImmA/IrrE family metallo-endopeptidase [Companilactobacillus metriopterae]|uniref:ImmA/IrrE family metallo-endopeptidase n=1 Tax=Companilactobacillus metriopterae TaxID=1909267 RepID=UPI00100BC4E2|nr:ImmA/IrrE family metallo-endopeptidase [Companilactobacillus metriopterae]